MTIAAICLLVIGTLAIIVSTLWLIVVAFRHNVVWGLLVFFVPLMNIVFIIKEWADSKRPFFVGVVGLFLIVGACFMVPRSTMQQIRAGMANVRPAGGFRVSAENVIAAPVEDHSVDPLAELREKEQQLRARKAGLQPSDAAGARAVAAEIRAYNVELKTFLERSTTGASVSGVAGWVADLTGVKTPSTPAAGAIGASRFVVTTAELENGILTLRDGQDFFADHEFTIFLFLNGESPAGRTFEVSRQSGFGSVHVHMKRLEKKGGVPKTEMFVGNYVMQLEFGQPALGQLPGRIYLCVPDAARSYLAGTFKARLVEKAGKVALKK